MVGAVTATGTITVNNGVGLYIINSDSSFLSDVKFEGNTTTCTTCTVGGLRSLTVLEGRSLTLLKGILLHGGTQGGLFIGNGTTGGSLLTGAVGATNEWPRITPAGVNFYGASGSAAVSKIDGLHLEG